MQTPILASIWNCTEVKTWLLDPNTWDLLVDASGNLAIADEPYAIAQDVASACKLAKGELWYNADIGIPYFQSILGKSPNVALIKKYFEDAALSVPGVVKASVSITSVINRNLTGTVNFTDQKGIDNKVII